MIPLIDRIILLTVLALPLLGAVLVGVVGRARRGQLPAAAMLARFNASMFSVATAGAGALALFRLLAGGAIESVVTGPWEGLGMRVALSLTPTSALWMVGVIVASTAAMVASSRQRPEPEPGHFAWLLALEGLLLLCLLSRDVLLLSGGLMASVWVAYLATADAHQEANQVRTRWLLLQLLAVSAFGLACLHLGWQHRLRAGVVSYEMPDLLTLRVSTDALRLSAWLMLPGLAILAGVWPGAFGLRRLLTGAPSGGIILVLAGLMKVALYILSEFALPLCLPLLRTSNALAAMFAVAAGLVAALWCYRQRTLTGLLIASSSAVAAMAVTGILTSSPVASTGANLLAGAHTLGVAGIFLIASRAIASPSRAPIPAMFGFARHRLVPAIALSIFLLISTAMPGMPGFVGGSMILGSSISLTKHTVEGNSGSIWLAVTTAVGLVAAVHTAILGMVAMRILLGRPPGHGQEHLPSRLSNRPSTVRSPGLVLVLAGLGLGMAAWPGRVVNGLLSHLSGVYASAVSRAEAPVLGGPASVALDPRGMLLAGGLFLAVLAAPLILHRPGRWRKPVALACWAVGLVILAATAHTQTSPGRGFLSRIMVPAVCCVSLALEWFILITSRTFVASDTRPSMPARISLLSLSGMPPTLGFVRIILVAGMFVSGGLIAPAAVVLASQAFIASACAQSVELPLRQPESPSGRRSAVAVAACAVGAGLLLVLGLAPGTLVDPLL